MKSNCLRCDAQIKGAGGEKLHHEKRMLLGGANVRDLDDVAMGELLADIRFVKKQAAQVPLVGLFREQKLHGEVAAAGDLHDFPDLAILPGHHAIEQLVPFDDLLQPRSTLDVYQYSSKWMFPFNFTLAWSMRKPRFSSSSTTPVGSG